MSRDKSDEARVAHEAAQWADRLRDSADPEADRERLVDWLEADNRHQGELEETQAFLRSPELHRALAAADARNRTKRAAVWRPRLLWAGAGGLAACAAALVATLALNTLVIDRGGLPGRTHEAALYSTQAGAAATYTLADGSVITLNGGSEIRLDDWTGERRIHLLRGDAHFQVAPDATRPFIVETDAVTATALGTAFTVSLLPGSTDIQVTEHTVRVASLAGGAPIDAVEGTMVRWSQGRLSQSEAPEDDWRTGWLDTDDMRLQDLADLVERTAGRRIILTGGIGELRLSGRFRLTDADALARRIADIHGLAIRTGADGGLELAPGQSPN
jgi:transmembrane sensor